MCGICGIYGRASPDELIASTRTMLDTIRHRGPDHQGIHGSDRCAIGANRLAIIDIRSGDQPIHNEDGSVWIVYNGEIYNFKELAKGLLSKGHTFYTNTDTEVIVHLYEEYGTEGFERLNGMFAFALYDNSRKRLVLARDRAGIKPLYHCGLYSGVAFASEMKALLSLKDRSYGLSLPGVAQYLAYDYTPGKNTVVKDIFRIAPGTCLIGSGNGIEEKRFAGIKIRTEEQPTGISHSENAYILRLEDVLSSTMKDQMTADVPVGIFLSGGIDSSTIAYFASRINPGIRSFSLAFEDPSFDESRYARMVSDKLGLTHRSEVFAYESFIGLFQHITDFMDDPIADPSVVPTYALSRLAGRSVRVVLSGEGGDEMFAGYPTYIAHKFAPLYNSLPKSIREKVIGPLISLLPVSPKNFSLDFIAKRFIGSASQQVIERHTEWMGGFSYGELGLLLKEGVFASIEHSIFRPAEEIAKQTTGLSDPERANIMDIFMYLPDDLLAKIDRATMAASVESRVPLLDNRVIEFCMSLPFEYKLRGISQKRILKKLMKDKLPDVVIDRKKKGFGVPITQWLQGGLAHEAEALLSQEAIEGMDIFNHAYIARLLREHLQRSHDHRKKLWSIMVLVRWLQRYRTSLGL
ncbi:MAG: asparagine synthase (glutamine-hydrolyzing) [Deltaproteobacteria bacterium]|nr:asparagine synthase (glutamine-hydrolyzing) [Deltaproteobacteria bacterium]MCL5277736.1 asparagine synthase (glutamine-hydrolyzing) [Deltaproteobacteria bacterium]